MSLFLAAVILFQMLVGTPLIVTAIAYAASKGKPKTFDREMYWTAFASCFIVGVLLAYFGFRPRSIGTSGLFFEALSFILALGFFGVGMGCAVGIFTYRRQRLPPEH